MPATEIKERPILFSGNERWIKVAASRIKVSVAVYLNALNSGRKICGGCRISLMRDAKHFGKESKTFDGMRSRCRSCVSIMKKDHRQFRYQRQNRERVYAYNAKWQREKRAVYRESVVSGYGHACICCGEAETLFLEIHHPNGDGKADRERHGGNSMLFYKWLIKEDFPGNYELLCANCHRAIHQSKDGVCPHKKNQ